MLQFYQIPCKCGKIHEVSKAQAGSTLTCECGETVQVPTMREIRAYSVIERQDPSEKHRSEERSSGIRERRTGLLFVLLMGAVLFAGGTAYTYFTCPQEPSIENAQSPFDVWKVWQTLRTGIDTPETRGEMMRTNAIKMSHRWIIIESTCSAVCLLGMLTLLLSSVKQENVNIKNAQ